MLCTHMRHMSDVKTYCLQYVITLATTTHLSNFSFTPSFFYRDAAKQVFVLLCYIFFQLPWFRLLSKYGTNAQHQFIERKINIRQIHPFHLNARAHPSHPHTKKQRDWMIRLLCVCVCRGIDEKQSDVCTTHSHKLQCICAITHITFAYKYATNVIYAYTFFMAILFYSRFQTNFHPPSVCSALALAIFFSPAVGWMWRRKTRCVWFVIFVKF